MPSQAGPSTPTNYRVRPCPGSFTTPSKPDWTTVTTEESAVTTLDDEEDCELAALMEGMYSPAPGSLKYGRPLV
ncbi:MAG TPA: hypothetical protein VGO47_06430 [Chlamydiales bacterium]|nr:hypothetical protein [Chlamydiales bacterium]